MECTILQQHVVCVGMVAFLEASMDSLVAPTTVGGSSTQSGSASSMAELKQPVRQLRTSVEAGPSHGSTDKHILFIGTLTGIAAIGLTALLVYGSYSGSVSGL